MRSIYFHRFSDVLFHALHTERGILQVIAQELAQVRGDDFGMDELRTVIFRLLRKGHMEELFFKSIVHIGLQADIVFQ